MVLSQANGPNRAPGVAPPGAHAVEVGRSGSPRSRPSPGRKRGTRYGRERQPAAAAGAAKPGRTGRRRAPPAGPSRRSLDMSSAHADLPRIAGTRLRRYAVATADRPRAGNVGRVIVTALTPAGQRAAGGPRAVDLPEGRDDPRECFPELTHRAGHVHLPRSGCQRPSPGRLGDGTRSPSELNLY